MRRSLRAFPSSVAAVLLVASACSGGGGGGDEANRPPTFTSSAPTQATEDLAYAYAVTTADPDAGDVRTIRASALPAWLALADHGDGTATLAGTPLNQHVGSATVTLVVEDRAGATATQGFTVAVANVNDPPTISGTPPAAVAEGTPYAFTPSAADVDAGDALTFSATGLPGWASVSAGTGTITGTPAAAHVGTSGPIVLTATDLAGASASLPPFTITVTAAAPVIPPDPATLAPPLDPTVATAFGSAVSFLYSGTDPIQQGVAPGTIRDQRAAVIRGRVLDDLGAPLPAVRVTVLGHPELGRTHSRADGWFDLAVNGGGDLTVDYSTPGFLPAQRTVRAPWRDFVVAPDVALVPLDPSATRIDLSSPAPFQVARGSVVTDAAGTRRATLLFPAGTAATMTLPGGSTQPLGTLTVRLTEYTVGPNGPKRMPAALPPSVAYTYAVELSADEALAVGATGVAFSQPVAFYVENFLDLPAGVAVPTAFYDRRLAQWQPERDGRVVEVLAVAGGIADVDTDGDGLPDDGAGIGLTPQERAHVASLYGAGQRVWRIPIRHFSGDMNLSIFPPPDATPPAEPSPFGPASPDADCLGKKCVVQYGNQVLGESLPLAGTPFGLHYMSDRVPGRRGDVLEVPVTGAVLHPEMVAATVEVAIMGRIWRQTWRPPEPGLVYRFAGWDGIDAYGRAVPGPVPGRVTVMHHYKGYYLGCPGVRPFSSWAGAYTGCVPTIMRIDFNELAEGVLLSTWEMKTIRQRSGGPGLRDALGWEGLGGWTLGAHHYFAPEQGAFTLGDGRRLDISAGPFGIEGTIDQARPLSPLGESDGVAVGPDGAVYVAETPRHVVWKGVPGTLGGGGGGGGGGEGGGAPLARAFAMEPVTWSVVAGSYGFPGYSGDGGPATSARLSQPVGLAVGADGSLYVAERGNHVVRRVAPDGAISTIAGTGLAGYSGDQGPAAASSLSSPTAVVVAPDGGLYIADRMNHRIRRVWPGGIIDTFAGTGAGGFSGDGGLAFDAELREPTGLAVSDSGELFIADSGNNRIRRVGLGGTITTFAGTGVAGAAGDGGPAPLATMAPFKLAFAPGRGLLLSDAADRVRRIGPDGIITREAGRPGCMNLAGCSSGDGGPARFADLNRPRELAVGPDGTFYVVDSRGHSLRRVTPPFLPDFSGADLFLPLDDGSQLFEFRPTGRHHRTLHPLTGQVLHALEYDASGLLTRVTDGAGNTLASISRSAGAATITGTHGQVTTLQFGPDGYLASFTNPAGDRTTFEYAPGGLLTGITSAAGGTSRFTYDSNGRLIHHEDAAARATTLALLQLGTDSFVTVTPEGGLSTTYGVLDLPEGGQQRTVTPAGCPQSSSVVDGSGLTRVVRADGSAVEERIGPDPRFGLLVPAVVVRTETTPAGRRSTSTWSETVTLADPANPLSLTGSTGSLTVNGNAWTSTWDAATSTLSVTSPAGRVSRRTIDQLGRATSLQVGTLSPTTITYDAFGRPTQYRRGAGLDTRTTTLQYGPGGHLTQATDPLGRVTTFEQDAAGRPVTVTGPDGAVVRVVRDGTGAPVAVETPSARHLLAREPRGLLGAYVPPTTGADPPGADLVAYAYDTEQRLIRLDLPDGSSVSTARGCRGRVETMATPDGVVTFEYHPATGKPARITDPRGVVLDLAWDGPLPLRQAWSGPVAGSVERAYDDDFALVLETVNGGDPVAFAHDPDGFPVLAGELSLAWDPSGLLTGTTAGLVTTSATQDAFGDLLWTTATSNATTLFTAALTRDRLGRLLAVDETVEGAARHWSYGYDAAGRLTTATLAADATTTWTYAFDQGGNRIAVAGPGGSVAATYDAQGRLIAHGADAFTWTRPGRLATASRGGLTTRYAHDVRGRLTAVELPDGRRVTYLLDGLGRRVARQVDGQPAQGFLYADGHRVAAELDGTGAVRSRFVYASAGATPDLLRRDGATYRIITDHLGSVRLVVDTGTGAVVQRIDYDPYGVVLADSNPGFQPFGFAGGVLDPDTGLVHLGARDYDPATGRFLTRDPLLFGGGLNLYAYAGGDPVNRIDPSGLDSVPCPDGKRATPDDIMRRIRDALARNTRTGNKDPRDPAERLKDLKHNVEEVKDLLEDLGLLDLPGLPANLEDFISQEIDAALEVAAKGIEIIEEHHEKLGSVGCRGNLDGTTSCGVQ